MKPPDIEQGLLEFLREDTGDSGLQYASPPRLITGGFSGAWIFGFELASPPQKLAGPLVFRMLMGEDTALRQRREAALQDAAGSLGCKVPRIRLTGPESAGLGGPFFIMDRLEGGPLVRWYLPPLLLAIVASVVFQSGWFLLLGHLLGSVWVGITLAVHQRRIHRLPLQDVKVIYARHGIEDAQVDYAYWLQIARDAMDRGGLTQYLPGLQWLRDHQLVPVRPTLCHGDIQPLNFLASWTRVTGIIDWEIACIADPELDVAAMRCDVILLPGPWLGPWLFPMYWSYLAYLRATGSVDPQRLRYYEALRTFFMLANATDHYLTTQRLKAEAADDIPGPDLPPFFMRMLVRAHVRRFHKLTGIRLAPPAAALR